MVKPTTHVATTQNCSTSGCHASFTSFAGATFNHTGVTSGTCYTCHGTGANGAMMENTGHVPTASVSCDTCHTLTTVGGFATYTMGTAGHTALGVTTASNCTTCHMGTYFGVVVKSASHMTTTPQTRIAPTATPTSRALRVRLIAIRPAPRVIVTVATLPGLAAP